MAGVGSTVGTTWLVAVDRRCSSEYTVFDSVVSMDEDFSKDADE